MERAGGTPGTGGVRGLVLGSLVLVVAVGVLVGLLVRDADEADRRTLAASAVDRTVRSTAPGSTPTSLGVAPTSTTTTVAPPPGASKGDGVAGTLDPADRVSITGIGPITVGMTVTEAQEAAGVPIGPPPGATPGPAGGACTHVAAPSTDPLVLLLVTDGVISRVDVREGSTVTTLSGIGVGATEQEVRDTYGSRIVEEPNLRDPGRAQLRYVPDDPTHSLVFELDGGVVSAFRSGFTEAVRDDGGCS